MPQVQPQSLTFFFVLPGPDAIRRAVIVGDLSGDRDDHVRRLSGARLAAKSNIQYSAAVAGRPEDVRTGASHRSFPVQVNPAGVIRRFFRKFAFCCVSDH